MTPRHFRTKVIATSYELHHRMYMTVHLEVGISTGAQPITEHSQLPVYNEGVEMT